MASVAATIAEQIGRAALFMIGAKYLTASTRNGGREGLQFKIMRNTAGITHVWVTLDPDDTYTVSFLKVRKLTQTLVSESSGIYADQLCGVIREATGLETRMPTILRGSP